VVPDETDTQEEEDVDWDGDLWTCDIDFYYGTYVAILDSDEAAAHAGGQDITWFGGPSGSVYTEGSIRSGYSHFSLC
jgi:hypothetical protein